MMSILSRISNGEPTRCCCLEAQEDTVQGSYDAFLLDIGWVGDI